MLGATNGWLRVLDPVVLGVLDAAVLSVLDAVVLGALDAVVLLCVLGAALLCVLGGSLRSPPRGSVFAGATVVVAGSCGQPPGPLLQFGHGGSSGTA